MGAKFTGRSPVSRRIRLYCAVIDYKKAFDLVDRSSLWSKLISCGINGNVLKVIYNMLENAKSCVKQISSHVKLVCGKEKTCFLCYLLFTLMILNIQLAVITRDLTC